MPVETGIGKVNKITLSERRGQYHREYSFLDLKGEGIFQNSLPMQMLEESDGHQ